MLVLLSIVLSVRSSTTLSSKVFPCQGCECRKALGELMYLVALDERAREGAACKYSSTANTLIYKQDEDERRATYERVKPSGEMTLLTISSSAIGPMEAY